MTIKKRRAKAGEQQVWSFDVLAYASGWSTRVTVRDRASGAVSEYTSLSRLWALRQAVKQLPDAIYTRKTFTATTVRGETYTFTLESPQS